MIVNIISKTEFYNLALNHTKDFLDKINKQEVFVVKEYILPELSIKLRNESFDWELKEIASWHKFDNDCPYYHRLHDNYPQAQL